MDLVLADEFRDGNVPAIHAPLGVTRQAFAALPPSVKKYYFRGDSACYEHELLSWLREGKREGGSPGKIRQTPSKHWKLYSEAADARKEYAVINYYPEEAAVNRYREPLRYIGIRVKRKQREMFQGGREVLHFAVATNLWDWDPKRLLE